MMLDGTFERTRSIHRVISLVAEKLLGSLC
jgi:hypothetical protein